MIKSFSTRVCEKIFLGEALTKKERKSLGELDLEKSKRRLEMLDEATEKDLLLLPSMKYHHLKGTDRYSIDADKRNSPWRITFSWDNEEMRDVEFVKIEDTH
jgi:plasmid maintenance system killer protein